jgi:hypothetical protein
VIVDNELYNTILSKSIMVDLRDSKKSKNTVSKVEEEVSETQPQREDGLGMASKQEKHKKVSQKKS